LKTHLPHPAICRNSEIPGIQKNLTDVTFMCAGSLQPPWKKLFWSAQGNDWNGNINKNLPKAKWLNLKYIPRYFSSGLIKQTRQDRTNKFSSREYFILMEEEADCFTADYLQRKHDLTWLDLRVCSKKTFIRYLYHYLPSCWI